MAKQKMPIIKCLLDLDNLTAKFGGEFSKPENSYTAAAVKLPPYSYQRKEREDAGGGCYYNNYEINTYTNNNAHAIIKDGLLIGVVVEPYFDKNIKSYFTPIEYINKDVRYALIKSGLL